ncbi:MAG TPA: lipid A biosynthesis lauroyl acyltransferase [Gammaproteobacteria bacterium]|nr:lipid A biosynthesis lauroyl acyltransferase [Gammaproteobacteria bacterium]
MSTQRPAEAGAAPEADSLSLRRFAAPKYWGTWALYLALRAVEKLPFAWQLAVGRPLGRLLALAAPSRRRIVDINLAACFPELSRKDRALLARRHFEAVGLSFIETAIGWFSPIERLRRLVRVEGREHLERALAAERGIIVLSAHFTPLETGFAIFEDLCPGMACMYRPQRNAMMDALILRGRGRFAGEQIPRDDVRALLRRLKAGGVVAYMPDQTYLGNQSALLPFFGVPAMTNVATAKMARLGGAVVLPYFFRRLPGAAGYVGTFMPPLEIEADDPAETTRRWVEALERHIRLAPEQYLWSYKKFKGRPPPLPQLYD